MATSMNYESLCKWFCEKYKGKNPICKIISEPTSFCVYFLGQYIENDNYVYIKADVMDMYEIAQKDLESKIIF